MSQVTIYIDDQAYQAEEGQSVLQVAIANGVDIPHLCYHEDLPIEANCRLCLVEHEGKVTTSCTLKASEGLKVNTKNDELIKMRQENLKLLLADHVKNCPKCQQKLPCPVFSLMQKYGFTTEEYHRKVSNFLIHKMGNAAEFDPNLCIKCGRCINACAAIGINFLKLEGKGSNVHLAYNQDPSVDCIYCGQCTVHCPVGAIREQSHLEDVEKVLQNKNGKVLIVQMAPSVRASIGEEFGQEVGKNMEKKMFTAFRQLGFDKVFDVNTGADITTMVEAKELTSRLKKKFAGQETILPMFTSCCPAWVKFAEFYYPDLLEHLTSSRSPHIHSGAAYKTWWADGAGVDPSKIVVVSIMPCTSKKYEAKMDKFDFEYKGHKLKPVDHVLTTREIAALLKKNKIDLPSLEDGEADREGEYSGAGAIYGASGGVMESALRTAYYMLTDGQELGDLSLEEVRGMKGIKRATIKIGDNEVKIAVVVTPRNARTVLAELKKDPNAYDYIEFMACPGGCIGGGGQPLTGNNAKIKERIAGLYDIDAKKTHRRAHENQVVKEFFDYLSDKSLLAEEMLYTSYSAKKKFE